MQLTTLCDHILAGADRGVINSHTQKNVSIRYKKSGSSAEKCSLPLSSKTVEIMDSTVDCEKTDEQCYENTTFIGRCVVFAF